MSNHYLRPYVFPLFTVLILVTTSEERCILSHSLCSKKFKKVDSNRGKMQESTVTSVTGTANSSRQEKAPNPAESRRFKVSNSIKATKPKVIVSLKSSSVVPSSTVKGELHGEVKERFLVESKRSPENEASKNIEKPRYRHRILKNMQSHLAKKITHKDVKSKRQSRAVSHRQMRYTPKRFFEGRLMRSAVINKPIVSHLKDNKTALLKRLSNWQKKRTRSLSSTNTKGFNFQHENASFMDHSKTSNKVARDLKVVNTEHALIDSNEAGQNVPYLTSNPYQAKSSNVQTNESTENFKENNKDLNHQTNYQSNKSETSPSSQTWSVSYNGASNISSKNLSASEQGSKLSYSPWTFKPHEKNPKEITENIISSKLPRRKLKKFRRFKSKIKGHNFKPVITNSNRKRDINSPSVADLYKIKNLLTILKKLLKDSKGESHQVFGNKKNISIQYLTMKNGTSQGSEIFHKQLSLHVDPMINEGLSDEKSVDDISHMIQPLDVHGAFRVVQSKDAKAEADENSRTYVMTVILKCIFAILGLIVIIFFTITIYLTALKHKSNINVVQQENLNENDWCFIISNLLSLGASERHKELNDRIMEGNRGLKCFFSGVLDNLQFHSKESLENSSSSRQNVKKISNAMSGIIK